MAKNYKREYLRKHYSTGIYVSNDGEYAERYKEWPIQISCL